MLKTPLPADFDLFWKETCNEAFQKPLDYDRAPQLELSAEEHIVDKLEFQGVAGEKLHGWIAYPKDSTALKHPSFLWVPPYSLSTMPPNQYGTRKNYISLSFNFHGFNHVHQETYTPDKGYFTEGIESHRTWIYRKFFQNCVIAVRILESLPEVDSHRIASMGMSQGGGISIWLGAWIDSIKVVCANMPFLAAMNHMFSRKVYRYPAKEVADYVDNNKLKRENALHTLSYFDTLHMAARCYKPTLLISGLRDPACPPDTVRAIYEALPREKRLVEYNWGHDWHPDMVQDNLNWMERFF